MWMASPPNGAMAKRTPPSHPPATHQPTNQAGSHPPHPPTRLAATPQPHTPTNQPGRQALITTEATHRPTNPTTLPASRQAATHIRYAQLRHVVRGRRHGGLAPRGVVLQAVRGGTVLHVRVKLVDVHGAVVARGDHGVHVAARDIIPGVCVGGDMVLGFRF